MKFNKLFLTASIALCCAFGAAAQAEQEVTETVFKPHWYIQGAAGMQETLGETSFGRLAAFNAQVGVGYNFNPVIGARFIVNGWTSKASMDINGYRRDWKWNYIAPTVDITADLVNLFGGYKPDRRISAGIFAGLGANVGFSNGEAADANKDLSNYVYRDVEPVSARPYALSNLWDGTRTRFVGQFGVFFDYAVSNHVKVGVELQANTLSDNYNSKRAENADWYFNGLVSVKYTFGSSTRKQTRKVPAMVYAEPQIVEKVVEKVVEVPVVKEVIKEVPAALSRDVFFKISNTVVSKDEMYKVAEIAHYMKDNPDSKVTVTGYADKGTGSRALNLRLSAQRSKAVADALINNYGIDASRITVRSMGDDEYQPYNTPEQNRVAVCVAK